MTAKMASSHGRPLVNGSFLEYLVSFILKSINSQFYQAHYFLKMWPHGYLVLRTEEHTYHSMYGQ